MGYHRIILTLLRNLQDKTMNLIIIGAGGHSKVVYDIAKSLGHNVIGFLDDDTSKSYNNVRVLGKINELKRYKDRKAHFFIAIGNNYIREKISLANSDVKWATLIHPTCCIGSNVKIDVGSVIMPYSVINANTIIGKHCIINTGAVIEHDNNIDDYVHISPNAALCGNVKVNRLSHIGAGAVINNNINIGSNNIIGSGAVVVKDTINNHVYTGVPAKILK